MSKAFYFSGIFDKQGPYTCYILFDFGLFKVIRFRTNWDNGSFYTWNTRVKFYWNVTEEA